LCLVSSIYSFIGITAFLALAEQDSVRGFYVDFTLGFILFFHHVPIAVASFYNAPSPGYNRRMLRRVVGTINIYCIITSHRNGPA
jgi:hypothetical protein